MAEPVVTMTKWTYFAWWAGVWAVTMVTLYFVVRYGVAHGMEGFVSSEQKRE